jgi:hypothetical protein
MPQFAKINPIIKLTSLLQVAKQMHQVHYSPYWLCKGEVQWIVATGKSLAPFSLCKRHHVKCGEVHRPDNVGACAITWRKNNCELQDEQPHPFNTFQLRPTINVFWGGARLLLCFFSSASSVPVGEGCPLWVTRLTLGIGSIYDSGAWISHDSWHTLLCPEIQYFDQHLKNSPD